MILIASYSLWWICPTRTGRCCVLLERLPAQYDRAPPNSLSRARKSCHPKPKQRQREGKRGQRSCIGHFNNLNIEKKGKAFWKFTFIFDKDKCNLSLYFLPIATWDFVHEMIMHFFVPSQIKRNEEHHLLARMKLCAGSPNTITWNVI